MTTLPDKKQNVRHSCSPGATVTPTSSARFADLCGSEVHVFTEFVREGDANQRFIVAPTAADVSKSLEAMLAARREQEIRITSVVHFQAVCESTSLDVYPFLPPNHFFAAALPDNPQGLSLCGQEEMVTESTAEISHGQCA